MRRNEIIQIAMLEFLLLGTAALGYAQQENKGGGQNKQEKQAEPARQQSQPKAQPQQHAQQQAQQLHAQRQVQQQHQHAQVQQQTGQAQPPQRAQTKQYQQQSAQTEHKQVERTSGEQQAQEVQQQGVWQQHRADHFDSERRTWQQRGGYDGYRVPDAYFSSNFGMGHSFRVYDLPFLEEGGYPRFQYEGYWFSVIDPYPEYWGADWYRNDDMYVDYRDDGYYLYDRSFPGRPGLAISISM